MGSENATVDDFEAWAHLGIMNSDERTTYDDLRRVIALLGNERA